MSDDILEIQVACFRLGDDLYAVDIMRIREIIRPQKLTLLPRTPAFVEGIINLRGAVIPVIDMRRRFGLPPRPIIHTSRLLIVTIAEQLIGLVVDDVTEVLTVPVRDIKPPPKVAGGVGAEYLIGVCLAKDSLIILLNLDRILTDSEADELGLLDGPEK
jgi:purine-binding chemotaxis protein CheW